MLPQARRFADLRVTDAELTSPAPVEESPRGLTASELLEDAERVEPAAGGRRRAVTGARRPRAGSTYGVGRIPRYRDASDRRTVDPPTARPAAARA